MSVAIFTFFYANIALKEQNYGENLRRFGAQIPNVHSGEYTQNYLSKIINRINILPALVFSLLAIMPWIFNQIFRVNVSLLEGEKLFIIVATIQSIVLVLEAEFMVRENQNLLLRRT